MPTSTPRCRSTSSWPTAPYTYLLESVQGGERFGRYSIIGLAAPTRIVVNGHQVLVLTGNRIAEREDDTNPLDFIGKYMERFRAPPATGLPRFCGGLVGCFGYDTVRYVETAPDPNPQAGRNRHAGHRFAAVAKKWPSSTTCPAS